MSDRTKIEWADATVNAVNGCSVVSPGCTNCYAMRLAGTRMKHHPSRAGLTQDSKAGPVWTGEVRLSETALLQPLKWKRPRRIFWNAHGDLFHDAVPDAWIDRVFAVCALTPQHTHMILTKRSARMREYFTKVRVCDGACDSMSIVWDVAQNIAIDAGILERYQPTVRVLPNVWLGVSVEDQARADERIPDLLATPAAVRFISAEPLLGPVDLTALTLTTCTDKFDALIGMTWGAMHTRYGGGRLYSGASERPILDWVIVGGESGPGARPMHPDWARSLRDQCAAAGVAFHFKQWGQWAPCEAIGNGDGGVDIVPPASFRAVHRWRRWDGDESRAARDDESVGEFLAPGMLAVPDGKKAAGRLLDGVEHNGVPA